MRNFSRRVLLLCLSSLLFFGSTHAQVVISQLYGGGGNSGSTYKNDYIEIFNRGNSTVNLTGWSVQYASSTGTTWSVTPLSGSLLPGQYYLIQEAVGAGGTTNLPTPDATGTIPMSATAGKVVLASTTVAYSGCPLDANVMDIVAFGTGSTCGEGGTTAPAPSNTNALFRLSGGCTDVNLNSADFVAALANPRNSASPLSPCSAATVSVAAGINGNEAGPVNGTFTLTLSVPAPAAGVTVTYSLGGSATPGSDYTDPQAGTITIPAGSQSGTITLNVNDDPNFEGTENISITLNSANQGFLITGGGTASINLLDNDAPPSVSVAAGANAAEPATNGSFNITLSTPAPAGGVTVTYTLSGTATPGSDYTDPQGGTVTITSGNNSATVAINVINDPDPESPETITLTINSVTSPFIINTASATINLTSDDFAPIPLTSGNVYTQDFNSLSNIGTTNILSIPGWLLDETGGGGRDNEQYAADNGGSNTGDTYSYGATGSTERALGSLQSGSLISSFGSAYVNNTGTAITRLRITYTGEQWRLGATGRNDRIDFQFSTDATSITTGTWTDIDALDFIAPNATGTAGALNGNLAANRTAITFDINGISIAPGATFYVRWNDFNASGADDGLAIDDYSIEPNPIDNTPPHVVSLSPANGATNVSLNTSATITFDEPVQKTAGTIFIRRVSDNTPVIIYDINNPLVNLSGFSLSFPLTNLTPNTGYYIDLGSGVLEDLSGNDFDGTDASTWSFTTGANFYVADFQTCSSSLTDGFTQYSAVGAITWGCTTFGRDPNAPAGTAAFPYGVQINGFANGTNVANTDWLISPSFDLTGTTYPLLSFWSRTAFNGQPLQLKVSTDYSGGNPDNATWTDINGKFPGQTSNTWTLSENINLAAFKSSNVHFAFVYTSSDDDGARWTLDDVSLVNSPVPPPPSLTVSTTDIQFTFVANGATADKTFTFTGNDLTNDVSLTSTGNFLLSKDGTSFGPSLNYTVAEANNITKTVYVRFAPNQAGQDFTGTVTVSTGALSSIVNLKGTSIDPAGTLEVVNWNLEWFGSTSLGPTNDNQQEQNVKTILQNIGADIFGVVEVVDEARLANVVSQMPGYSYVIGNFGSHVNPPDPAGGPLSEAQKLAFIYKTSMFTNVTTRPLINNTNVSSTSYNNWSSGRYPFLMTADVTLNCVTKHINFVLVHAKANTSPTATSYARRQAAATELHDTLNTYFGDQNIIMLGDFNDDLDQSITAGFTTTSYSSFTDDNVNFFSPTLALSLAGKKSTVSYNDMIDHVMLSNEMAPYYMPATANVLTDVSALVTNYGSTTTDHYPVFTRYKFEQPAPPVIHCPAPVEQNNDEGVCGAVVNYTVTYEGNCGTATLQQLSGLPSGAVFPTGTTTNTYKVTDAAGGSATCSFTVTIHDTALPSIVCPGDMAVNSAPGICSATVNYVVTYSDNCSGATIQQTAGLPSGSVFPAGVTTNTFVVTDASGNTNTCSFTVTVSDHEAPTFTRPVDVIIPFNSPCGYNAAVSVTGDVTNEHDNCATGLQATYTDVVTACGNNIVISRTWHLNDGNGNAAPDQVQTITVTDNNTPYIIYATREARFGEKNTINGAVGVTASNGVAEFDRNTIVPAPYFVRSKNIIVHNGASIANKIFSAANDGPNPPFYIFSGNTSGLPNLTISNSTAVPVAGNYKNLTIKKNVSVTLIGTLYEKIQIDEGAHVTFSPASGVINIGKLEVDGKNNVNTYLQFGGCTAVRIRDKVTLEDNVQVNNNGPKVTFYLGDNNGDEEKFKVSGGDNNITANVYIPNGKLKVEGENNHPTVLNGWFLAEKVETGGKDIIWNAYRCTPVASKGLITSEKTPAKDLAVSASRLQLEANPNPSSGDFVLRISSSDVNTAVTLRISDMAGRLISVRGGIAPNSTVVTGSELKNGLYIAEIWQGNQHQVVKLVKL